jgi:hypothetical protein
MTNGSTARHFRRRPCFSMNTDRWLLVGWFVSLLVILSLQVTIAHAQPPACKDPQIVPSKVLPYQQRQNRCEGFYDSPVAGTLELLAFLTEPVIFNWQEDVVLDVSAPGISKEVNVRAVGLPLKTYYRMDARLKGPEHLVWPIRDVLYPGGLNADRIGAFGWRKEDDNTVYLPLRIVEQNPPSGSGPRTAPFVIIRSSVDIETVRFRWATIVTGRCGTPSRWEAPSQGVINAGQPLKIGLATNRGGSTCLEVRARPVNQDTWLPLTVLLRTAE